MARGRNFHGFSLDLAKFADKIGIDIGTARKKIAFDLFEKIIDRTPVEWGPLRMSWAMADGVPVEVHAPDGGTGGDSGAAAAAARANITATFLDPFEVTWITNALLYAERIEFGHSRVKAPAGMVRVSLVEEEIELKQLVEL